VPTDTKTDECGNQCRSCELLEWGFHRCALGLLSIVLEVVEGIDAPLAAGFEQVEFVGGDEGAEARGPRSDRVDRIKITLENVTSEECANYFIAAGYVKT
jgi:hypothetical protein